VWKQQTISIGKFFNYSFFNLYQLSHTSYNTSLTSKHQRHIMLEINKQTLKYTQLAYKISSLNEDIRLKYAGSNCPGLPGTTGLLI